MKTLTVYALMLGTGLMTLLSTFKTRESHHAPLTPIELNSSIEFSSAFSLPGIVKTTSDSSEVKRKKEYHIYFENRSEEPIEVAIRFKDYNGGWDTDGLVTLKAGEKRHMGVSDQKTYFYYAENKRSWKKRKWTGKYKFPIEESDLNKARFVKQDIWECYDTKMCNTFAVFR